MTPSPTILMTIALLVALTALVVAYKALVALQEIRTERLAVQDLLGDRLAEEQRLHRALFKRRQRETPGTPFTSDDSPMGDGSESQPEAPAFVRPLGVLNLEESPLGESEASA